MLLILSILFEFTTLSFSQSPPHWRYWRTEDGLWEAVTEQAKMGKGGKLWITHGAVENMSIFDGYAFEYIPSPAHTVPVYECESGQIWSYFYDADSSTGGLQQFIEGEWIRYPIDKIHSQANSFYPLGENRVLCLVSSGVVLFDAIKNQTTVVKNEKNSSLGQFENLAPALDGSVWISCQRGLARFKGLDSRDSASLTWDEYYYGGDLDIDFLRNLVVGENGEVFGRAHSKLSQKWVLVSFDGQTWKTRYTSDEYLNCGWPGTEDSFWILNDSKKLQRIENNRSTMIENKQSLQGQIRTVSLEKNGCFWLTTTLGLVRYAPSAWRCPGDSPSIGNILIHRILEDNKGRLWLIGQNSLLLYHNNQYKVFSLRQTP